MSFYIQLPHARDESKCMTARGEGGYSTKFCFYLVNFFNRILDTGKYPALWSFGLIVPIHKKDDRSRKLLTYHFALRARKALYINDPL